MGLSYIGFVSPGAAGCAEEESNQHHALRKNTVLPPVHRPHSVGLCGPKGHGSGFSLSPFLHPTLQGGVDCNGEWPLQFCKAR